VDTTLRAAERRLLASNDDEAAGRALLSDARRAADARAVVVGLSYLSRLGALDAHDELARRVPWCLERGRLFGTSDWLRQAARDRAHGATEELRLITRSDRAAVELASGGGWSAGPGRALLTPLGVLTHDLGELRLRDPRSGAELARCPLGPGSLSVEGDRALVALETGALCLDLGADFGRIVWSTRRGDPVGGRVRPYHPSARYEPGQQVDHPKFGEGVVVRADGPRKVVIRFGREERALAQATGPPPADPPTIEHALSGRAILAGSLALLVDGPRLVALDARDGRLRFEVPNASVTRADARGIVASIHAASGRTEATQELDPAGGAPRWTHPGGLRVEGLAEERVVGTFHERDHDLVGIDRRTGEVAWRVRPAGIVVALAEREVVRTRDALDLATGQPA
jgi:hypothetical protein